MWAAVLLRYVGDVDARDDRGLTALHFACQPVIPCYYKTGIIQDLLEYGADVNATDKHGQVRQLDHAGGGKELGSVQRTFRQC